jgi:hypothetical protein
LNEQGKWVIEQNPAAVNENDDELSQLGGVGHCFAWHVRVSFGFYFNY